MCFSAEVSFGAAAVITSIGIVSFKKAQKNPYRLLTVIPLLFGFQQFVEGFVWLSSSHDSNSGILQFSTYIFVFIAWIIWPIYIPWSIWKIEKNPIRKKMLLVLIYIGTVIASSLLYLLVSKGVKAEVNDCSIMYTYKFGQSSNVFFSILYLSTTVLPNLISKVGKIWILGVLNLITYFVSQIYYADRIISVWCFFAAISSIIILLIILDLKKDEKKSSVFNDSQ